MVNRSLFYVLVYVDDLAMAHKSLQPITALKEFLHSKYGIKALGSVAKYTSYEVLRNRSHRTICLHQNNYIKEVLASVNMESCYLISAPAIEINHLSRKDSPQTEAERFQMKNIPYRSTIGALLHIANRTRPDIAHAVSVLSRFNQNPGLVHWNACKKFLRYLKGTAQHGLLLGGTDKQQLVGYVDANYGPDPDSRRSTSGYAFLFGSASILSKSKLQHAITTSSCQAELAALFAASSETIWLRRLLSDMGYDANTPTMIYEDNQAAIKYSHTRESYGRMKHIDLKHKFIREHIKNGVLKLEFIRSDQNVADILTKSLTPMLFQKHRTNIGLSDSHIGAECQSTTKSS
jgi:hypothetical protein